MGRFPYYKQQCEALDAYGNGYGDGFTPYYTFTFGLDGGNVYYGDDARCLLWPVKSHYEDAGEE